MSNPYLQDFPFYKTTMNDKRLVYLDNAATTQKPSAVIETVKKYYEEENANPHRGAYALSIKATQIYENARELVRQFIGAADASEIIFTRNTTESINLVAYSYGLHNLKAGDEILIAITEHHSNLVPWQRVAQATGAILKYLYLDKNFLITDEEIETKITAKTRLVGIAEVSNVLGTINPVEKIITKAHAVGAVVVVDGAQSVPHMAVDVQKMDADFFAFSGHKMLAPMGIGVLYGKAGLLNKMPPFLSGGDMIEYVREQDATYAPLPAKFEAGTQNVGGAAGLAAAIKYLQKAGYPEIQRIEHELTTYAIKRLRELPYITVYGNFDPIRPRAGVISFNVQDVHPHDVSTILDADGVAIRAGHHCAHPLMKYLGVVATCRASFYLYNTKEDIDVFIESLTKVRKVLGYESK